ncbi:P-loop containing nucleoside triphosphate hydrolases superfamily protein, partial [Striga hermonthica]
MRELALANVGAINRRTDLSKKLSILSPRELRDLVCTKLKLVSKNDPCSERVDFIIKVVNLRKRLSMPFHYIPTSRKRLSMHLVYQ